MESWYFEVWNEPDLPIFFHGKQQDYFELYAATARTIKNVDAALRVGGPSTSACRWVGAFKSYCEKNDVPFDFLTTHHYPGDGFGNSFGVKDAFKMMKITHDNAKNGVDLGDTLTEYFFKPDIYKTWTKGILRKLDETARQKAGDTPLFMTEWNSMAVYSAPVHDEKYSAAFLVKSVMDLKGIMDAYMFWCCSDVFEELFILGKPFHGSYGIVNNDGIPKPNFWGFKLLSQLYPERLDLPVTNDAVEYSVFVDGEKTQILLYAQDFDYAKHDTTELEITINTSARSVTKQVIDDNHCNPKAEWLKLGKPDLLTPAQVNQEAQMLYIGIDLWTSACKLLLVTEDGSILNTVTKEYPLIFPHPSWSEQKPEDWWDAVVTGVPELLHGFDANEVAGIGTGGQMHGLVALDAQNNIIRPAILWNDGRTSKEVDYLNNVVGKDKLSALTANIAFAGFTAPKLLWMRENELENFRKNAKIMLPKDYLTYKLTGVHACDYSDASGMLLLDVQHKCWSQEMLDICGIHKSQMPKLYESFEVVGQLTKEAAQTLGLPETVKVVAGAGDNAAAAVGTGTVGAGGCNISLGTSGTIFISSDKFGVDPNNALHAFAHADGGYHLMGCMLSAASCNKWLCEEILKTSDFASEQADITDEKLGENHVYFLPYLMGERSPINDTPAARSPA